MTLVLMVLPILSTWSIQIVQASWIDPDTPMEARTTRKYNVKYPPTPKPSTTKSHNATAHRRKPTTESPTAAPTPSTDAPSRAPSSVPTLYPTFDPSEEFQLVFSDEFNTPNRQFYDGADPRWTAMEKNDYTNDALHYYSTKNVRTNDHGELEIKSEAGDTEIIGFDDVKRERTKVTKHFRSAMLQSWNKFCLTGGIIEAKVQLPGKSNVGGLWPAFWLLGNLARHTYVGSSEHLWPWSSSNCTPTNARKQAVSGCDHVSHYGMPAHLGRGAPEIDIFEVQPGDIRANVGPFAKSSVGQPFMSASYQVAPGRAQNRPGPGEWPGPDQWYSDIMFGANTSLNILFYGTYNHFLDDVDPAKQDYWSDAISYNRQLSEDHFNSSHVYRLEWDVPSNESDGYLHWFLDGQLVSSINGKGLRKSKLGSEISSEPSYFILNTAISKQWGFPQHCPDNCPCKDFDCNSNRWQDLCGFSAGFCKMMKEEPPVYKIDWIRAFQNPNDPRQKVGCSTPERPTRKYIVAHEKLYKTEFDDHPLKGVPDGLGSCDPHVVDVGIIGPDSCGGPERGRCTAGRVCECLANWTGPHCLSTVACDDILYDPASKITDVGFVPPEIAPAVLFGGLGTILVLILLAMQCRHRLAGWEPVPDAKYTYAGKSSSGINQGYSFGNYISHRRGQSV